MSEHARHAMSAQEALWVREHAWLPVMRRDFEKWPVLYNRCTCRRLLTRDGTCPDCQNGRHEVCDFRTKGWLASTPAGWVTDRTGQVPVLGSPTSWQFWDATVDHDPRCICYTSGHPGAATETASFHAVQGDLLSLLEVT